MSLLHLIDYKDKYFLSLSNLKNSIPIHWGLFLFYSVLVLILALHIEGC